MATIRAVVQAEGLSTSFTEADISASSTWEGGGMSLLMAQVEPDTIHLVSRWRSDKIPFYLHTTANSFTEGLSANIIENGAYVLIPPAHAVN